MSEHAHVKIGDACIPLIGIPLDATEMLCDHCLRNHHVSEMHLLYDGRQFLCADCFAEHPDFVPPPKAESPDPVLPEKAPPGMTRPDSENAT